MIQRIDSIKDFGIFRNYSWGTIPGMQDFKEKNIIYGWNYSGKTTLSRVFSSLRDQTLHHDFPTGLFKLTCDQGTIDQASLASFPYKVAVFNAEYAKENLRWEYDEHINAIFFEVGDNAKITSQIEKLSLLIEEINGSSTIKGKKEKHQAVIDEYNKFETLYTQEAGRIKNDVFASSIEFNKGHLRKIKDKILTDLESHIIGNKDDLSNISKTVKVEKPKPQIDIVFFQSTFQQIVQAANEALLKVPSKSKVIAILDKNTNAYEWARTGLNLHNKNDHCYFCGNEVSEERYNKLVSYFENESSQLKLKINEILGLIAVELSIVDGLNIPSSVNDFNDGFQEDFQKKEAAIAKERKKYKALLNKIGIALKKKLTDKIYSKIDGNFQEAAINPFLESIERLQNLISQNNEFVDNFEEIINNERDRYKNHLVALFLKQSNYIVKEARYKKAIENIDKLNAQIEKYNTEIQRLKASKESDAEGCVQFNAFVQSFLGRDDIKIELNNTTKKFNLMRDGILAQNLSEGEKMAISFSHFLVTLKSIEQKGILKDYIVYIDDPISSLDSNHIFQINSLLKETFFHLVPDPLNPKSPTWQIQCRQLFISTHNFEFFTLLKELPKKGYKKDSRYFIARKLTDSSIEKLPNVYNTFYSEYHYLFGEILSFTNEQDKSTSNKLLIIPNILRRFVEMYTLTKFPSNDEVDARAEIVFGKRESKRILKLLHHFSHFNSIDRIHKHSEFVADIEHACNDLISLIKKDKMHYDALEASIS
jgi:wobble nucleotide-excising tRNase